MTTKTDNGSESQAKAQFESIREMVEALEKADAGKSERAQDEAREAIQHDPLSVRVRSDWHTPGDTNAAPGEFEILLCTGGPACRIIGSLSDFHEPDSARIEHQDWGTPWTEYRLDSEEEEIVLKYCREFWFGQ